MKLYSWRWSTGHGGHWKYERDVTPETKDQWINVFSKDEPEVVFKVSYKKPRENLGDFNRPTV